VDPIWCAGVQWIVVLFELIWPSLTPSPAGTGKSESVEALGNQLGRFVLVFNCDETFDFQVRFAVVHCLNSSCVVEMYLLHITKKVVSYSSPAVNLK